MNDNDVRIMEHEFKMSLKQYLTTQEVVEELRLLANGMSTQKALAEKMGISAACLCDVLEGRRLPGPAILQFLKLERVIVYREAGN